MAITPELLDKARAAGADLAEAERRVLTTRADYHTAIRRMHLAGAPLREIAEALSLSHQRVQQIVNVSGGSWWRRAWRTRRTTRGRGLHLVRSSAERSHEARRRPEHLHLRYLCDCCGTRRARTGKTGGPLKLAKAGSRERCSFCQQAARRTRGHWSPGPPLTSVASACASAARSWRSPSRSQPQRLDVVGRNHFGPDALARLARNRGPRGRRRQRGAA